MEAEYLESSVLSPEHLQPVIHLQNVTKIYGSGETAVIAVNGVSLSVSVGELVLILGPREREKQRCFRSSEDYSAHNGSYSGSRQRPQPTLFYCTCGFSFASDRLCLSIFSAVLCAHCT